MPPEDVAWRLEMGVVQTILLVAFVIVCVLLVLLVLVQNEDDNGMGSAFGGGASVAFGARSASVLTRTTGVLVVLFFLFAFGLSFLNRAKTKEDLSETVKEVQGEQPALEDGNSWLFEELNPSEE